MSYDQTNSVKALKELKVVSTQGDKSDYSSMVVLGGTAVLPYGTCQQIVISATILV